MLNKLVLMGRATKDPVIRKPKDTAICNFVLAIDNLRNKENTSFFPVVCFGALGENVSKYIKKGSKIVVTGSIEQRSYLNKDGEKRVVYEVYADGVEFLDPVEKVEEPDVTEVPVEEAPKFDPYTGKPLNPETK